MGEYRQNVQWVDETLTTPTFRDKLSAERNVRNSFQKHADKITVESQLMRFICLPNFSLLP